MGFGIKIICKYMNLIQLVLIIYKLNLDLKKKIDCQNKNNYLIDKRRSYVICRKSPKCFIFYFILLFLYCIFSRILRVNKLYIKAKFNNKINDKYNNK